MPKNILLLTADDMDARTPASFGGPIGVTPALDALASQGMTFLRAHVVAAVCQPSRSAIMSGKLPHRNGAEGFNPIADDVVVLTDLLREVGYLVGILGKVEHLEPVEKFGWDMARGMRDLGLGRDPAAYGRAAERYFADAAREGRPWFLMANAHDPHRPFHGSAQEAAKFPADELAAVPAPSATFVAGQHPVPGFLPDLEDVRTEFAQYLSSARRCDDVVAAVLTALQDSGQADDTVVVFLSDNGMAFPFAKANCYLQSTHTPFIIRWPGLTSPGAIDEQTLISMLDLLPTFCDAADIPAPDDVDGKSLVHLMCGGHRDQEVVFTVFHETSGKRRFEMRCVQDVRYGYIWNHWSDGERKYVAENMEGLSWAAMERAADEDLAVRARTEFYRFRVSEELYDLDRDPNSLENLIDGPSATHVAARLRLELRQWMRHHGDPLADTYATFLDARKATACAEK
jgi:N-sulfoglucosamine sulfohydrolase